MTTSFESAGPTDRSAAERELLERWLWWSLTTEHAHLADGSGVARRYRDGVSRFAAFDPAIGEPDQAAWADLAAVVGPGGEAFLTWTGPEVDPPAGWTTLGKGQGLQMVLTEPERLHADAPGSAGTGVARDLTDSDVPAMLALVALTDPGPFLERTIEMGRYLGTFEGDQLVAMAGERAHLTGFTEISAVCTHPDVRGRGLASSLVGVIADGIIERGETPFLNVRADNPARSVYERLGFTVERPFVFRAEQFG